MDVCELETFLKEIISKLKGESSERKRDRFKLESEPDQQNEDTVIERLTGRRRAGK